MPSPETLKVLGVAGLLVMQNVHLAHLRRQVQELEKQTHTHEEEGVPVEEPAGEPAREGESREASEGQKIPEPAPA